MRCLSVLALASLAVGACGISEPVQVYNVRYSGFITVDGRPVDARRIHLTAEASAVSADFATLAPLRSEMIAGSGGSYDAKADINSLLCDNLWLVVESSDQAGDYAHYLENGCGDHTLDLTVSTNVRLSGKVTLDGASVQWTGDLFLILDQTPPDLRSRLLPATSENGGLDGDYSVSLRVDPRLCDHLWIWLDMPGVDSPIETVPGCGTHVIDLNLSNG